MPAMSEHLRSIMDERPVPWSLVLVGLCVALFSVQTIYSITFHPLAAIPGPKICGMTRIPYFLNCFRGLDVFWINSLHRRYGPVVRFGPRDISFASAEAWKQVNGVVKNKRENEKALEFFVPPVNGVHSIMTTNYEDHARFRHCFSSAFSERAIQTQQQPLLKKYTNLLISKLKELSVNGDPVEMTRLFECTTFDITAEVVFGQQLVQLESNDQLPWVSNIFDQLRTLPVMSLIAYYPVLTWMFDLFEPRWIKEKRREHCAFSEGLVRRRVQGKTTHEADLWRLAMKDMTTEEMNSNAELFMIAGSETVATTLSGTIFYLLKNPQCLSLLTQEIRAAFPSAADMTCEALAQQPYLKAVIRESMRIFPAVGVGSPRVVGPSPQTIQGYTFPPGTRVSTHHYSTYHSASNFRDPDVFAPERWLNHHHHLGDKEKKKRRDDHQQKIEEEDETSNINDNNREEEEGDSRNYYAADVREAHFPFSSGPRDCLGQTLARHETRMLLAALVREFDIELCESSADWDRKLRCYALWDKGAIECRLRAVAAPA